MLRCYRHHRCRLSCHPHCRRALRCTEQELDAGSIYASATLERGIFQVEQDAEERAILYRGGFEEGHVGRSSGYGRVVLFFFGTKKLERRTRGHMMNVIENRIEKPHSASVRTRLVAMGRLMPMNALTLTKRRAIPALALAASNTPYSGLDILLAIDGPFDDLVGCAHLHAHESPGMFRCSMVWRRDLCVPNYRSYAVRHSEVSSPNYMT